ncbi:MAG: MarR family winged helix-turn-helix transcriptional regulator [Erysipelotrichaceae bacterium]|jgi:MarR family transcriptional regulator, 2-MHQ and catechol-resistance regulon repressor
MINDLKTITILFRATNQIEKIIAEDVALYGLNPSEFGALEVLYHKGPLPVQSICEKVLIASSSMSYVIENLIKKDFILKTKDIQDKRYHIVELTNKGRDLMNDIYPKHVQKLRKYIDILNQNEELSLQTNLKKLGKQEK